MSKRRKRPSILDVRKAKHAEARLPDGYQAEHQRRIQAEAERVAADLAAQEKRKEQHA